MPLILILPLVAPERYAGNSLLLAAVAFHARFMRIFPASDLGPGQGFERRVCPVPGRIEVAAVKRYQRARGFERIASA
jgi:hypothetical protein